MMVETAMERDLGDSQPPNGKRSHGCRRSEHFEFFRAWLANPLRVASILPSSNRLSLAITKDVSGATGPILELGPGTGVFTRTLLLRGVAERNLTLVEGGTEFITTLRRQFPEARVLFQDAAYLRSVDLFHPSKAGAVISGLPLLSMSSRKVTAILLGAFRQLRPDGAIYQFTYGPRCPVPRRLLDRLGLKAARIATIYANVPPASVYRIVRRKPLGQPMSSRGSLSEASRNYMTEYVT